MSMKKKSPRDFKPIKLGKVTLGTEIPHREMEGKRNPEWERVLGAFFNSESKTASLTVSSGTIQGAMQGLTVYAKQKYPNIMIVSRKSTPNIIYLTKRE